MNQDNRRLRALIALFLAALLVTAGCDGDGNGGTGADGDQGEPVRGGTLNMLGDGDVDYMDPNIAYYSVTYQLLRLWSRQLFTFPAIEGETTTAAPDLATEIPTTDNGGLSADGLTYTIKIREGAMWDTEPARQVTADDVVRGVKRTCNPVQPFGGLPNYLVLIEGFEEFCDKFADVEPNPAAIEEYIEGTDVSGLQAQDDLTMVFKLNDPATYFVDMLTLPAFSPAPVEVLKYLPGSQQLGQNQISDGPYSLESWSPTKEIVLVRNPAWDESTDPIRKAYVDKVVISESVSQESVQQQLETGTASADMQWDVLVAPSQLPRLMASEDARFNLGETSSSDPYIVFNMVSPNNNKALADLKVRQALEHALSRDNLIQVLGGPKANPPLTHVLPPSIAGSEDIDLYPYDTDKAEQLLSEAGYENGLTLKFLYRSASEGQRKSFATVQQDLSKIGIKVTGVASADADFYTKYLQNPDSARSGEWDLAIGGWGSDWYGNAALSYFAPLFSGEPSFPPIGSNFGFYDNPETNALIEQARTADSEEESLNLWAEADRQVMEDAAFFPITNPLNANFRAEHLNNAVYIEGIQNFDPANVWLSADMQGG